MTSVHPCHFRWEFPPKLVLCEKGNKEPPHTGTSRGVPQAINRKPMRKVLTHFNHPVIAMDTVWVSRPLVQKAGLVYRLKAAYSQRRWRLWHLKGRRAVNS